MSFSLPQKSVNVLIIGGEYLPVIYENRSFSIVDGVSQMGSDLGAATAQAKAYATANNTFFNPTPMMVKQGVVSIKKEGNKWYPVNVTRDEFKCLKTLHQEDLGRVDKDQAFEVAKRIAKMIGHVFIPLCIAD
jgi:hypothetical protein